MNNLIQLDRKNLNFRCVHLEHRPRLTAQEVLRPQDINSLKYRQIAVAALLPTLVGLALATISHPSYASRFGKELCLVITLVIKTNKVHKTRHLPQIPFTVKMYVTSAM